MRNYCCTTFSDVLTSVTYRRAIIGLPTNRYYPKGMAIAAARNCLVCAGHRVS